MKTFQEFLNEADEYAFLKKAAFKKQSHLMNGKTVYSHPLHGHVFINKHQEWEHKPHGSTEPDDGFGGSSGVSLKAHIDRLNAK